MPSTKHTSRNVSEINECWGNATDKATICLFVWQEIRWITVVTDTSQSSEGKEEVLDSKSMTTEL